MILFVYCCKKSHKSIIEVSFLADFWLFSLSQFSALSFLYQILHSIGETFVDQLRHVCQFPSESHQAAYFQRWTDLLFQKVDNLGGRIDVHPCRYSSLCFLWMLVGIWNDSAQNKSNNWAFVARRIGSVCPRLVLLMPAGCSADARPLVRKGSCGDTNFFNFFNFPFAKVGLMIDYLNNVE